MRQGKSCRQCFEDVLKVMRLWLRLEGKRGSGAKVLLKYEKEKHLNERNNKVKMKKLQIRAAIMYRKEVSSVLEVTLCPHVLCPLSSSGIVCFLWVKHIHYTHF